MFEGVERAVVREVLCSVFLFLLGYLQPELLIDRLEKGDVDGLLDRHWCCLVKRKKVLFEDIGEPVRTVNQICFLLFHEHVSYLHLFTPVMTQIFSK